MQHLEATEAPPSEGLELAVAVEPAATAAAAAAATTRPDKKRKVENFIADLPDELLLRILHFVVTDLAVGADADPFLGAASIAALSVLPRVCRLWHHLVPFVKGWCFGANLPETAATVRGAARQMQKLCFVHSIQIRRPASAYIPLGTIGTMVKPRAVDRVAPLRVLHLIGLEGLSAAELVVVAEFAPNIVDLLLSHMARITSDALIDAFDAESLEKKPSRAFAKLRELRLNALDPKFDTKAFMRRLEVHPCAARLKALGLVQMPRLTSGDLGPLAKVNDDGTQVFPKLERLEIETCHTLSVLVFPLVLHQMPQLKHFEILNCNLFYIGAEQAAQELIKVDTATFEMDDVVMDYYTALRLLQSTLANQLRAMFQ